MRFPVTTLCLGLLVLMANWQPVRAGPLAPPSDKPLEQTVFIEPPPPPPPESPPPGVSEQCQPPPILKAPPPGVVVGTEGFPVFPEIGGPRWKLLGGVGIDLVGPFQENNRAFTVFLAGGKGSQGTTQSTGFGDPFTVASRFWLGFAGPGGWGFRTSLWNFDQDQHRSAALNGSAHAGSVIFSASPLGVGIQTGTALLGPGNADVFFATQRLHVNVLDFELTREIEAGNVFLVFSAGGRLARISQQYNVDIINTDNDFSGNAEEDRLFSGQRFVGGGPTLALQAWYPLGMGAWSLYGTVRGSFLFGDFHQFVNTNTLQAVNGTVTETLGQSATFSHGAAVPMGELELGIQWSGQWGRFHPFLRTGVEAKTFFNALSGSTVQEVGGDSASLNSNLSFFGVTFQAGVNY